MAKLEDSRKSNIHKKGSVVYRPLNTWSKSVHRFLHHLEQEGITESPRFIGIEGNQEKLSLVEGLTFDYPLIGNIATSEALITAAKLLRRIHDASVSFLHQKNTTSLNWMLEPREPYEVICHGDFAPYNIALIGNNVVGVFDFDAAHPAPRLWDIAYALYCWAPFKTDNVDRLGTFTEQTQRAKLFCDSYGLTSEQKSQLPEFMFLRIQALVNFMKKEAMKGNRQFADNIEQGHHLAYLSDIEYIKSNAEEIRHGLIY
ncbi:phosphotransferase [Photobacterium aquae]|uniref:Phosphotransferase n=1 Tax=Photobacterium aquae TaxID=1195763 RepID=A0A0J1GWH5_9GAMM|nr:aminoglycoside phosphotransferase family protein [Photobacterium aquae]KLV03759.1 phosphotransferase [Photobacterium aquae]